MKQHRFTNPHVRNTRRGLKDLFLWKLGYYRDAIPKIAPPEEFQYPVQIRPYNRNQPSALWIGHSTFLIEIDGLFILTDPVWENYCSPVPFSRLRRLIEPAIPLADLPPIDIVLISHNHYDHLDHKTVAALQRFHPQIEWIVPEGLSPWFKRRGISQVFELKRWDSHLSARCQITAVPSQHFSGRTLWDFNKTHWNGYVVETYRDGLKNREYGKEAPQFLPKFSGGEAAKLEKFSDADGAKSGGCPTLPETDSSSHFGIKTKRFYFTGDTGYNPVDFKMIGDHWPYMDLSLIPIGTYSPEIFMKPVHIGPYEAVLIHQEVKSRFSLGMHWKTFRLSDEPMDRPPYDLYLAMQQQNLSHETFLPGEIGTYVNW